MLALQLFIGGVLFWGTPLIAYLLDHWRELSEISFEFWLARLNFNKLISFVMMHQLGRIMIIMSILTQLAGR